MKYKAWLDDEKDIFGLDRFDPEIAKSFVRVLKEETEPEELRYWFSFIGDDAQGMPPRQTRQILSEHGRDVDFERMSVFGAKSGLRIIITAMGKGKRVRFFDTEAEALAWLLDEKKKAS